MTKSLIEIQDEVRTLEAKARELTDAITGINKAICDIRNSENNDSADFDTIRILAKHYPFGAHPLSKLNNAYACRLYIKALLSVAQIVPESESRVNRLAFIQWILTQSGQDDPLEAFYHSLLRSDKVLYGELVEGLPKSYHIQLIVDMLVVANICGPAEAETLDYIAGICSIFGIGKAELRNLILIASAILRQNVMLLNQDETHTILSIVELFQHYLDAKLVQILKEPLRTIAISIRDDDWISFNYRVQNRDTVSIGTILAVYRTIGSSGKTKEVKAPCSGTAFRFRKNRTNYLVIAHETDNEEAIKEWVP